MSLSLSLSLSLYKGHGVCISCMNLLRRLLSLIVNLMFLNILSRFEIQFWCPISTCSTVTASKRAALSADWVQMHLCNSHPTLTYSHHSPTTFNCSIFKSIISTKLLCFYLIEDVYYKHRICIFSPFYCQCFSIMYHNSLSFPQFFVVSPNCTYCMDWVNVYSFAEL